MTTQLRSVQSDAPTGEPDAEPAIRVTGLTKVYGPRGEATSRWGRGRGRRSGSGSESSKAAADDVT